jgi:hypothetical protein
VGEWLWIVLERVRLPRLVALGLVVAFLAFPAAGERLMVGLVRARAAAITSALQHELQPMLAGMRAREHAIQHPVHP